MDEIFEIDPSPSVVAKADALFHQLVPVLRVLCPEGEVHHVGGTAISGVPTKGDLDIQIRLPAETLEDAAKRVSEHYSRNDGGFNPPDGYSFEGKGTDPEVGIHLTSVKGTFDVQWVFTQMLNADAELRRRYAAIKNAHTGKSMYDYREAKGKFFEELSGLPAFGAIQSGAKLSF